MTKLQHIANLEQKSVTSISQGTVKLPRKKKERNPYYDVKIINIDPRVLKEARKIAKPDTHFEYVNPTTLIIVNGKR